MTASIPVRPGHLREAAEQIERQTGLHVEIIGGVLMMSPTPRGKHGGTVAELRDQLIPVVKPRGLNAYEMASVAMPDDDDDYATPDLTVLPVGWANDDDWLVDPQEVALAVEIIPKSERSDQIADKVGWYATAGVAVLLQMDPRSGKWTLFTHPRGNTYQGELRGVYGENVPLTDLLPPLATGNLPLYG